MSIDELVEAIEQCFDKGWTDGFPVVPPVPSLVEKFLAQTSRDPNEVIWYMDQVKRGCTVEFAAINAVMAGCRPEYFPVVLAALEATVDEGIPGTGGWQSTTGGGPMLIVNGPVRHELGFNCTGNVLGPGFRANATVGRAMRLIIMNAYGIRPHQLDQSTHGWPGKTSLCIGENEEDSPWEPLHVELGFDPGQSVVSALHTRSCEYVNNRITEDPHKILDDIADTVTRTGSMTPRRYKRVGLVMGPVHANLLARGGLSKQDVKEYLSQHAGRPAWMLRRVGRGGATNVVPGGPKIAGQVLDPPTVDDGTAGDDDVIRTLYSPKDILVVVAGSGNAGVTTVAQTLGFAPKVPGRALVAPSPA
jgi:hypothetical protein